MLQLRDCQLYQATYFNIVPTAILKYSSNNFKPNIIHTLERLIAIALFWFGNLLKVKNSVLFRFSTFYVFLFRYIDCILFFKAVLLFFDKNLLVQLVQAGITFSFLYYVVWSLKSANANCWSRYNIILYCLKYAVRSLHLKT